MRCPVCHEENLPQAQACAQCGTGLTAFSETGVIPEAASSTRPLPPPGDTVVLESALPSGLTGELSALVEAAPDSTAAGAPPVGESTGTLSPTLIPGPTGMSGNPMRTGPITGVLPPQHVFANRYEILSLLGEGGMGRVYRARDRELDRVIALKTLLRDADEGSQAIQRFKQELLLARRITHKNVIRIHDLGEANGIKFFTMEYIEGDSLKALIRRGRLPAEEALRLFRPMLGGLQEAHAQGVIHRDLKPQNVMVHRNGTPYIMDFGIARSVDTTGLTGTGAIVGTPDYISPEQIKGEKADEASDIFSAGVILYEMLTGDLPYHGENTVSKIMMRLTKRPRPPRDLAQDIPRYLEAVVLKCMEVDPALRYHNVAEVLADLDRGQVDRALTLRARRALVRRRAPVVAMVASAALAGAAVYWATHRAPAAPPPAAARPPEVPVRTVAIVPFTNAAGTAELEWLRAGLPEMLVTDLSQSQYVRPVPGDRLLRVLQEAGLAQQSRFDEAALESVSKQARADSVLSGQFVESGGRLRLDLTLHKGGSGVSVPLKVEGQTAAVFSLVDEISRRVKEQLDLSPDQLKGDSDRPIAEVSTASLEAQRAYQAGLAQIRKGANQEAVPLLKEATEKDPKFAMAFAKLAEAYLETGQPREAEPAIERARTLSDTGALPLAQRYQIHATAALAKEDYGKASESLAELAKMYPEDPDLLLSLARAYERRGKLPDALSTYERLVRLEPSHGAALLGLGRVQVMTGHAEDAVRSLEALLRTGQFEKDREAMGMVHSILGVAYKETGKFDQSLDHLTRSLEIRRQAGDKRGEAATLQNLATVYEYRGEPARSLDAQKSALALYRALGNRDGESRVLTVLGGTYKDAGNLDKALATFRESLQIEMERQDHGNMGNRLNLIADIYRLKGQYDDAMVYLDQAKTHLDKTDEVRDKAINLLYTGYVRRAQGLYEEALAALLAALPLYQQIHQDVGIADTQMALGEIYAAQGRYGDARAALEQSLSLYEKLKVDHDVAHVKVSLARLLVTLGRTDEAARQLDDAERLIEAAHAGGMSAGALLARAELALARGQREEATGDFEKANVRANLSGQKELAVQSRIDLARFWLERDDPAAAEKLLVRTREEARGARLRPLEAEAAALLAEARLARGDAAGARKEALEALSIAEKLSARPVLYHAQATLAASLESLGRRDEALDAYAKAASILEWMRGGLRPEDVDSFMARHPVQVFVTRTADALGRGGRGAEAASLLKWKKVAASR